jgi:hypothetical protein
LSGTEQAADRHDAITKAATVPQQVFIARTFIRNRPHEDVIAETKGLRRDRVDVEAVDRGD